MVLNSLVYRPNRVPQRQRYAQTHTDKLVYLRMPRSRLYYYSYLGFFGVGMAGTTYGLYSLITGKPVGST